MEFFLVPLLAIAVVTFSVYKLAELVFHIHLSCRLLILLVGFAWLISLVLPGLFFHSAGFLGSVGISLVSAVGFAWLATIYDARTQASQPIPVADSSAHFADVDSDWTPPAEAAFPVGNDRGAATPVVAAITMPVLEKEDERELSYDSPLSSLILPTESMDAVAQVSVEPERDNEVQPKANELEWEAVLPVLEASFFQEAQETNEDEVELEVETSEPLPGESIFEEPVTERTLTEEFAEPEAFLASEPMGKEESNPEIIAMEALQMAEIAEIEYDDDYRQPEQPASDSLEDLLDFAFLQRSRQREASALETFQLVKHLYSTSDALPMVVAEIVSTLQSQGDYA